MAKDTKETMQKEISDLQAENQAQHDQLIKAGVIKPDTLMNRIHDREERLIEDINALIKACEEDTGRGFDIYKVY